MTLSSRDVFGPNERPLTLLSLWGGRSGVESQRIRDAGEQRRRGCPLSNPASGVLDSPHNSFKSTFGERTPISQAAPDTKSYLRSVTRGRINMTKCRSAQGTDPPPPHRTPPRPTASVGNAGIIGRGFAYESITAALPPKTVRSLEVISEVQPDQSAAEMEGSTFMKSF